MLALYSRAGSSGLALGDRARSILLPPPTNYFYTQKVYVPRNRTFPAVRAWFLEHGHADHAVSGDQGLELHMRHALDVTLTQMGRGQGQHKVPAVRGAVVHTDARRGGEI